MPTTAETLRNDRGPAIFSFGFRPFFLSGAIWAFLAMARNAALLWGGMTLPSTMSLIDTLSCRSASCCSHFRSQRLKFFCLRGAVHSWTAGAIGLMTLAVMTRASLGHTGQDLIATPGIVLIYLAVAFGALAWIVAGFGWQPDLMLKLSRHSLVVQRMPA